MQSNWKRYRHVMWHLALAINGFYAIDSQIMNKIRWTIFKAGQLSVKYTNRRNLYWWMTRKATHLILYIQKCMFFRTKYCQPYLKRDLYAASKCFSSLKSSLITKIGKYFIMRFISFIECEMTQRCMCFLWNSVYFGFVLNLLIQTCFLCFDWPWKRRIKPAANQLRHFNTIRLVSLTGFIDTY